jgi:hypothetical protein
MRALLSSLPDPGPMPPDLVDRINAALAAERLQLEQGGDAEVIPFRRRRWGRAALVAAAVAAVAIGIPALVTGTGPGDLTALLTRQGTGEAASSASALSGGSAYSTKHGATPPIRQAPSSGQDLASADAQAVTMYATSTAYTTAGLHQQLRTFVDHPGAPMPSVAAAPAQLGRLATPQGIASCLHAVGVMPGERVAADLATFDGAPAVILVVSTDMGQRGFVLSRDCADRQVRPLAGPVAVG